MNETHEVAKRYINAGLSVIPLTLTGTKSPACLAWKQFQFRRAASHELVGWFVQRRSGIGIVCGLISGGFEVIDFDDNAEEIFPAWFESIDAELRTKLAIVETGGLGYHVAYRCETISGNEKLAMSQDKKRTYIETRGEGGYIVAVGSPLDVHASGRPYAQVRGPYLNELTRISPGERDYLMASAAEFDQRDPYHAWRDECRKRGADRMKLEKKAANEKRFGPSENPPWEAFARSVRFADLLPQYGWSTRDGITWTRPGKAFGTSARLVKSKSGDELLTVFSANAGPLSPEGDKQSFNIWEAWVRLEHQGNYSEAAKAAYLKGFGK